MSGKLPIEAVVAELQGDLPVGQWSGSDEAYRSLNKLRRTTLRTESAYNDAFDEEARSQLSKPEWNKVLRDATEYLTKHAKHLWVAAWLTEAAFRVHGFTGMRYGIQVMHQLVEKYWETGIYPWPTPLPVDTSVEVSPNDFEDLLSHVVGLDAMLPEAVQRFPITGPLDQLSSKGFIDFEDDGSAFRASVGKTREAKPEFFVDMNTEMLGCVEDLKALYDLFCQKLETRLGAAGKSKAPSFSKLESSIGACQRLISSMVPELKAVEDSAESQPDGGGEVKESRPMSSGTNLDGSVQSRDEAFRVLERIAKFFEKTEPHSPISYNLRKVVRWGRMSLDDLLAEILKDGNENRDGIFRLIGIPEKKTEDSESGE